MLSAPKNTIVSTIRDTPQYKIRSFLLKKYTEERLSPRQISEQIFSARSTVVKHLKLFGIPLRPEDEERKRRRSPAFGQRRRGSEITTHKRETKIINHMLRLRAEGLSFWKIAATLNQLGTPTKTQKGVWTAKQVWQVLKRRSNANEGGAQ